MSDTQKEREALKAMFYMHLSTLKLDPVISSDLRREVLEAKAAVFAEWVLADREKRVALIEEKFKRLEAGMIAISGHLDKPFVDDPRWTPWSRYVLPRMKMVREAIKGNDIGELAALAAPTPNQTPGGDV